MRKSNLNQILGTKKVNVPKNIISSKAYVRAWEISQNLSQNQSNLQNLKSGQHTSHIQDLPALIL